MPEVSIVVAAYRPHFLDLTIASALAQTFRDFELLISDDSDGDDVKAVVAKWTDERIRYTRNPRRQQPKTNRDHLIALASGKYVKFLWDDDYLFPQSVEVLVRAAQSHGAQLAFHHRYFVDDIGRPEPSFEPLPSGQVALVPAAQMFEYLVSGNRRLVNVIGEPSNLLVETEVLRTLPNPFDFGPHRVRFIDDIALFLNVAAAGYRTVGVGIALSTFRHHADQMSNPNNAMSSSGVYEWELLNRWSADGGHITKERCTETLQQLRGLYAERLGEFPELGAFLKVDVHPGPNGRFLTPDFERALRAAGDAIDARHRRRQLADTPRRPR